MPNGQGLSLTDLFLIQLELVNATPEEAERILDRLVNEKRITQEQLNELSTWYRENVGAGKEEEVSPLVRRERQIALDEAKLRVSRDPLISWEEKKLLWGPEGQKLAEAYLEEGDKTILDILGLAAGRVEGKRQEFREKRETALSQVWEQLERQPLTAPYLKDITDTEIEEYVSGQSDKLWDKLLGITEQANLAQRARSKEAREAQRAEAFFGGMAELGRIPPEEEFVRPPIPGEEKVAKSFLEETGLAKGTKLRSFLAGEFIPGIAEETKAARGEWWRRMHPEPERGKDIGSQIAQLQEEARRWAGLAWGPRAAPETEVSGGTYYGEGGLRAVAERAYRHAVESLGERQAERERGGDGEGRVPAPGEDPFIAALRERRYKPEYYRRPGAGLVSRLTPAIRY